MIEVVTSRNALLYRDALLDMQRTRDRLAEHCAVSQFDTGGPTKDRFDGDDAIYLLLTEDDGTVIGAQRLLPTLGPHYFADVVPQFCAVRGVQRGERILELTCACVDEDRLDKVAVERARNCNAVGLIEFCLRAGYEKITTLMPTDMLYRYLLIGLEIKPLGLPARWNSCQHLAVMMTVDRTAFDALRLALGVGGLQVDYIGACADDPLVLSHLDLSSQPRQAAE